MQNQPRKLFFDNFLSFFASREVGGISGYVSESTFTNCHNFGFQYDPSAVILFCRDHSYCGGILGDAVRANSLLFLKKLFLKMDIIQIRIPIHCSIKNFTAQLKCSKKKSVTSSK